MFKLPSLSVGDDFEAVHVGDVGVLLLVVDVGHDLADLLGDGLDGFFEVLLELLLDLLGVVLFEDLGDQVGGHFAGEFYPPIVQFLGEIVNLLQK